MATSPTTSRLRRRPASARRGPGVRAHGRHGGDSRRLPGRGKAKQYADHQRRRGAERDDPQVEGHSDCAGQKPRRNERGRRVKNDSADRDAEPAAEQ